MAQPKWLTPAGNLGTIPEGIFYQIPLSATDPDGGIVYFKLIAGQLPDGIQVKPNGSIEGTPKSVISVQGVPTEVTVDVTNKFAIRAYTTKVISGQSVVDRVNDQTFTITITGQDVPEFITPAGLIAQCYDGTEFRFSIEFTDSDLTDRVQMKILTGELPPGLILDSRTGVISGVVKPLTGPPGTAEAGYSSTSYDEYPYDFATRSASKSFQFTLELTDGKDSNIRTYSIYVWSRDSMSADTTDVTADNTFVTADVTPVRTPLLLTPEGNLGRVRADNFYAFKFDGIDFDGDPIEYAVTVGEGIGFDADGTVYDEDGIGFDRGNFSLPIDLRINKDTGWFYGYLADIGATEQTYRFAVRVKKANNPTIISPFYYFTLTVIGNVETEVIWLTKPDLGTINNGAISTLAVEAYNVGGRSLEYRLAPGTNSELPQGLTLLQSGHISGKVSFNTFALDGGSTTFDIDLNTRLKIDATTFDMTYRFTVNAYSPQTEDPGYQVAAIVVNNGGSNYGKINVTFSPPGTPGGITATGVVTLVNGTVSAVTITNQGSGYLSAPTLTFDLPPPGGIQAQASATLSGDRVSSVTITTAGSGYAYPTVTIAAPPNSINAVQAAAGYVTVTDGIINSVTVGNPGRGYLLPPAVTIAGAGGADAVLSTIVEIINVVNAVSTYRTFTVTVVRAFDVPYEKLYIKAMPPLEDRALINQLVSNQDIFPVDVVYRRDDPNFGVSNSVIYDHAYGLTPSSLDAYAESMYINHYWKNLILGEIKVARALDSNGNVLYEAVYSQIQDDQVNSQGQSVSKSVTLPYPVVDDQDQTIDVVYPNSLINMRDQVISQIGQISPALPLWMTSKQSNGRVLGFVPAWVIAYVKPGLGNRTLYNIQQIFGEQLNKIDFKADRYELDRSQTHNWDVETDKWIPSPPEATTFDRFAQPGQLRFIGNVDYATTLSFFDINYRSLDYIRDIGGIDGIYSRSQLDGKSLIFFKQEDFLIGNAEAWTDYYSPYDHNTYDQTGYPYDSSYVLTTTQRLGIYRITVGADNLVRLTLVTPGVTYDSVYITGGATFAGNALYIPNSPGPGLLQISWQYIPDNISGETIFDGGSTRFIAPADRYTTTDVFDRYLLFPRINILDPA